MNPHAAPIEAAPEAPWSAEAEQAVIAAALMRPETLPELRVLAPGDFYAGTHARIWDAISKGHDAGQPLRPLHLKPMLDADEDAAELGGFDYLNGICLDLLPRSMVPAMARLVKDMAARRSILGALESASNDAREWQPDYPAAEVIGRAVEALGAISIDAGNAPPKVGAAVERILARAERADAVKTLAVPSGLNALDEKTGGFRAGEFWVIAGRPGMGKTIVGANIARHAAQRGHGVLYVSMEMGAEQIGARMLCDLALDGGVEIWTQSLRKGGLPRHLLSALVDAEEALQRLPLFVEERRGLSAVDVSIAARTLRQTLRREGRDLDCVIIDHIGLMSMGDRYKGNKVQEVTELTRGLKVMAGDMKIPVIGLCQLNREVESRNNKDNKPKLSDLRDSGSIEQDADGVVLLYREEYYHLAKKPAIQGGPIWDAWNAGFAEVKDRLELNVAKNREGETGTIEARVLARCSAVRDA
jgi:replicative DNA helicase